MPKRPNKLTRILVPVAVFLLGLTVVYAVVVNTTQRNQPQPQTPPDQPAGSPTDTAGETQAAPADQAQDAPSDAQPTEEPDQPAQPSEQAPLADGLFIAEGFAGDPLATDFDPLGQLGLDSPYELRVEFSHLGAGIKAARLAKEFESVTADREARDGPVDPERHVLLQGEVRGQAAMLVPFCSLGLEINGTLVPLVIGPNDAPAWRQVSRDEPGRFEAFIQDAEGNRVLRIERHYTLQPGRHDILIRQHVENLTGRDGTQPLAFDFRWLQFGPIELFADTGYGGDKRRLRFGYLFNAERDPSQQWVDANDFLWDRRRFVKDNADKKYPGGVVWPNERSVEEKYQLVWTGMTNRYFAAVMHPIIDPTQTTPDKSFDTIEQLSYVQLSAIGDPDDLLLKLTSPATRLAPGATARYDMGVYAGPLNKDEIRENPVLDALGVPGVVVYNFGSFCAFCTFSWLTAPLLGLLRFLHSLTSDWALAIILLVVCVRTILHPITRWSQVRMLVFGKQMQNMAPKQKALQERFKDDKQRLQQEMAKLWREEGISPAGFLGCLPMLLQSPVWIALYAMLFFAIELRHEPAFFGVFQALTGNSWLFLADLAEPDRAIYFGGQGINVFGLARINSLNILPLFLGVVFYVQQKYLTPPPSAALSPEQESQQKMMKIMMVVLFPLIMYPAPSGLAIYFITNSALGIVESRWIRANATKKGLLETDNLKKKPKKGGFMAKLRQLAEEQQKAQGQRGTSAKRQPRIAKDPGPNPRRYKKKR